MQNLLDNLAELDARLTSIAPMGYSLVLNIREFTPEFYRSTYPDDWLKLYHERRYMLFDPITTWWKFNQGKVRWSEIKLKANQEAGGIIMGQAAQFGLKYGGLVALGGTDGGLKSLLSAARSDREMRDDELTELESVLAEILNEMGPYAGLGHGELEALRDLADGMTHNEIADLRNVSPATVKKRIERARSRLGAKNAVQAVAIATRRGLILNDLPIYTEGSSVFGQQDQSSSAS